jgi:hypothetical protein
MPQSKLHILPHEVGLLVRITSTKVDNYIFWRQDRTSKGGGLAVYLRSDIAGDRKRKYEFESVESISVEIIMNKKKWLLIGAYKPPTVPENICTSDFSKI